VKKKIFHMLLLITALGIILSGPLKVSFGFEFLATALAVESEVEWTILIYGAINHPIQLNLTELAAMPQSTVYADLCCMENFVTGGNWTGVRLSLILEKVEIDPQALSAKFSATDDYNTELWLTEAVREDVIIAYAKDEQPLPETLRLVFPGQNGHRWISMITQIEISLDQASILEMSGPPIASPLLPTSEPSPTPKPSPTPQPTPSPSSEPSPSPSTLPATETQNRFQRHF
jgi:DMSO/TMAO reductase YedYZ molybdopterin-dependent catalytic subunit